MFPPAVNVPAGFVLFAAVYAGAQAVGSRGPLELGPRFLPGAVTLVLLAFLMRVQDELKDLDTDLALARAGDARFADRPVVRGRVSAADLDRLRRVLLAVLALLNVALGFPLPLLAFAAALLATWLSGRWFFYPAMARSLPLAFATHNPIALLDAAYAAAVAARDLGPGRVGPGAAAVVLGAYLPLAAWELARKVRAPADETAYETWSSRLGWRTAGALPALLCAASAACLGWTAVAAGAPFAYLGVLGLALALVAGACLRFLRAPSARTAHLRPAVEAFAVLAAGGLATALALGRGVHFLPWTPGQ